MSDGVFWVGSGWTTEQVIEYLMTQLAGDEHAALMMLVGERDALKAQVEAALKEATTLRARVAEMEKALADAVDIAREFDARQQKAEARVKELEERRFPVLDAGFSVPWSLVAPFEAQAQRNHSQTLQRLAERGGLDPVELWAVMHGMGWKDRSKLPSQEAAKEWALSLVPIEARAEKAEAERDEAVASLRALLPEVYGLRALTVGYAIDRHRIIAQARAVLAKYPEGR